MTTLHPNGHLKRPLRDLLDTADELVEDHDQTLPLDVGIYLLSEGIYVDALYYFPSPHDEDEPMEQYEYGDE